MAALLGVAAFAYANLADRGPASKAPSRQAVTLSGHVDDLRPGATAILPVRAKNNTPFRVRLRRVRATVGDAGPSCPRTLLQTSADEPRKRSVRRSVIKPKGVRTVQVSVTMVPSVPDACQKAIFPLRFRARVVVMRPETGEGTGRTR